MAHELASLEAATLLAPEFAVSGDETVATLLRAMTSPGPGKRAGTHRGAGRATTSR
jgi:hypothetical protein